LEILKWLIISVCIQ